MDSAPACVHSRYYMKKVFKVVTEVQYLVENISLRYRKAEICDGVTTIAGSYGPVYIAPTLILTSSHVHCCVRFCIYQPPRSNGHSWTKPRAIIKSNVQLQDSNNSSSNQFLRNRSIAIPSATFCNPL